MAVRLSAVSWIAKVAIVGCRFGRRDRALVSPATPPTGHDLRACELGWLIAPGAGQAGDAFSDSEAGPAALGAQASEAPDQVDRRALDGAHSFRIAMSPHVGFDKGHTAQADDAIDGGGEVLRGRDVLD